MQDNSMQAVVTDVEKELLLAIIQNLRENRITEDQARALAKEFLTLLPMQDHKDLLNKLYTLSQHYVEAKGVYLKYAKPFEEQERLKKIEAIRNHFQNGDLDQALAVAKGGTN